MNEFTGLTFSAKENQVLAHVHPTSDHPLIGLDSLRMLLIQSDYGKYALQEDALATLVEAYNTGTTDFELVIGERRDASFTLEISPDSMQAWTTTIPACGGKPLDPDEIYGVLDKAGIIFGIDQAAINTLCTAEKKERFLVASGTPVENGRDARFELLIDDTRDRTPQVDANGLINFRELGAIPTVSAEQPLLRRIPSTIGTIGRNVRGQIIEPTPGRTEQFAEHLIGAYIDKDDNNLLRAVSGGQPVRSGNGVNVEQVLHIRNVNMATGNISFDGTVNIDGEVLPGMRVQATGDIVVADVVDGAELDAGGDVRVGGGIIAKAHVRAGGSVSVRFVENSQIHAGTTIAIDDTALQCELQADNQIIVGIKVPQRGRLAGGSARAMMLIKTPILGLPTGGVTTLLLGVSPSLETEYQNLLQKIEKLREDEGNLEKLVKHLTKQGDKADMLERVKASWQQAVQSWAKLLPEKEALEKKLALIAEARIEVSVCVDGAIDMTFGKKVKTIRQNYKMGVFSSDGEHVIFTDPMGNIAPAA